MQQNLASIQLRTSLDKFALCLCFLIFDLGSSLSRLSSYSSSTTSLMLESMCYTKIAFLCRLFVPTCSNLGRHAVGGYCVGASRGRLWARHDVIVACSCSKILSSDVFSRSKHVFFFVSFLFARTCLKGNLNRPRLLGRENEQSKKPTMRQDIFLMVWIRIISKMQLEWHSKLKRWIQVDLVETKLVRL